MLKTKAGDLIASGHGERLSKAPIVFLRIGAVMERTGLAQSTIYWMMSQGCFPKPVKFSAKGRAWIQGEVEAWIAARIAERDSNMEVA